MINASISHFTGPYETLNGERSLPVSRISLARSVMTVGYRGWRGALAAGSLRLVHLYFMCLAHTRTDDGRLCLAPTFIEKRKLDPSEKGSVSYHFGQGLTALCGEILLGLPWMLHLSLLGDDIDVEFHEQQPSKRTIATSREAAARPDLIAIDDGKAHVFESKGYTSGWSPAAMQHALDQVSQVTAVNGREPSTRVACFHDLSRCPFHSRVMDPEGGDGRGLEVSFPFESFIQAYYAPFLRDVSWRTAPDLDWNGRSYRVQFLGSSFYYGLDTELYEALLAGKVPKQGVVAERPGEGAGRQVPAEDVSIGRDGVILVDAGGIIPKLARRSTERWCVREIAGRERFGNDEVEAFIEALASEDSYVQLIAARALGEVERYDPPLDDISAVVTALAKGLDAAGELITKARADAIAGILGHDIPDVPDDPFDLEC